MDMRTNMKHSAREIQTAVQTNFPFLLGIAAKTPTKIFDILFLLFRFCPDDTTNVKPFCLPAKVYMEHSQCFPREDVFLIFTLGSVRGNTVPRGGIDPYTPGSRECIVSVRLAQLAGLPRNLI